LNIKKRQSKINFILEEFVPDEQDKMSADSQEEEKVSSPLLPKRSSSYRVVKHLDTNFDQIDKEENLPSGLQLDCPI
jgi:hypothetical protein